MTQVSSNNKRIAKNTIYLYFRMGIVLVTSLYTTRVILQSLGLGDYGIYNVVAGFVSMYSFLNTSISNGIQRFYNFALGRNNDFSIRDVYNNAVRIQFVLSVLLLILMETIGLWYIHTKMVIPSDRLVSALWVFQFSIVSLILLMLQAPFSAAIMAYERMNYYAYLSLFDVFAKLMIAYAIKFTGADKLIMYGALNMTISILSFLLYYGYAKRNFNELRFENSTSRTLLKSMISFSSWNLFDSFAYMIRNQGLNMLLNTFFGPIINAARGVSEMVSNTIQGFQSNVVVAFRPQLVQSFASGNNSRVYNLFCSLSKISFIFLAVISIPVMFEAKYILHLWLGGSVPDYTVPFTKLVLMNVLVSSLNTPISQIVHATGKMKYYQITTSLIICAVLPVSWMMLKVVSNPIMVYWTTLCITITNQVVSIFLLKRIFPYSIKNYCEKVIYPCLFFLIVVVALTKLATSSLHESLYRLFATCIVDLFISSVVIYVFVLNKYEKTIVLNYLVKLLRRK